MTSIRHRLSSLATVLALLSHPALADVTQASKQSPQDLIDALHSAFGNNHSRAVHAKGIILSGSSQPSDDAHKLSASPIFSGGIIPVTVRFSDFTGIPTI